LNASQKQDCNKITLLYYSKLLQKIVTFSKTNADFEIPNNIFDFDVSN